MKINILTRFCQVSFVILMICQFACHGVSVVGPEDTELGTTAERPRESGLRAGFVDDNVQYNWYLNFLERFKLQARHFPMNVQERIVLEVQDSRGNPLPNAEVRIREGDNLLTRGRSHTDGTFLFFPSRFDSSITHYDVKVTYRQISDTFPLDRQGMRRIPLKLEGATREKLERIPLDLTFILDTTGSMGEEIERLRAAIEIILMNMASITPRPDIRLGMVRYKDRGGIYVTQTVPLTRDFQSFEHELRGTEAQGGGDYPESLQQALHDHIRGMDWNRDGIRMGVLAIEIGIASTFLDAVGPYLDIMAFKDDIGMQSGPIISPAMFRDMIKPRMKKLIDTIRSKTQAKLWFHSCGSVYYAIPDLIELGVDILNPVQVQAKEMDTARLKREFGNRLAFWGGVDTQQVLPFGTPEAVAAEVRQRLADLAPGGGYVLASVHNLEADVPGENIWAMYQTAHQYGRYPLN